MYLYIPQYRIILPTPWITIMFIQGYLDTTKRRRNARPPSDDMEASTGPYPRGTRSYELDTTGFDPPKRGVSSQPAAPSQPEGVEEAVWRGEQARRLSGGNSTPMRSYSGFQRVGVELHAAEAQQQRPQVRSFGASES